MSVDLDASLSPEEMADFREWQGKVQGANISGQTLLATDYLNHFNEIVMLLGMVPDMPDILEDCKAWEPKSYQDHFRDSGFSDRDLAIAAYDHVPALYKTPFEDTIAQLNHMVAQSVERLDEALGLDDPELVQVRANAAARALHRLIEVAGGIIHGAAHALDQDEIDDLLGF